MSERQQGAAGPAGRDEALERLREEVRALAAEVRQGRRDGLRGAALAGRGAVLLLVGFTLGFVLALSLTSGFHWGVSAGLAVVAGGLVYWFLFGALWRERAAPARGAREAGEGGAKE